MPKLTLYAWLFVAASIGLPLTPALAQKQITILYDAFGPPSTPKMDWGFAALIQYGGRQILFDTGNNAKIFEHNVKELGVDLKRLDAVVISHRHGDHTSGLNYLLQVNPEVKVYAPVEGAYFNGKAPLSFLKREQGLPPSMTYYRGSSPDVLVTGSPWPDANFQIVSDTTERFCLGFLSSPRSPINPELAR